MAGNDEFCVRSVETPWNIIVICGWWDIAAFQFKHAVGGAIGVIDCVFVPIEGFPACRPLVFASLFAKDKFGASVKHLCLDCARRDFKTRATDSREFSVTEEHKVHVGDFAGIPFLIVLAEIEPFEFVTPAEHLVHGCDVAGVPILDTGDFGEVDVALERTDHVGDFAGVPLFEAGDAGEIGLLFEQCLKGGGPAGV
ncbi:hypothetical protein [Bifidobacterium sp. ESL0790]|uniref:hypothetical protein n=1 Tax=Bifidobacterium sp. ESL0790 TaxID=2983233 RepID=UPI0023F6C6FF|nr:hypothetical protein [Bifidobacterium sp. ESL0790]WEV71900.1 hypothetical protein OZY47_05445 [Bifidobacterium sp. ESL0790]